jgi:hypothetical protein
MKTYLDFLGFQFISHYFAPRFLSGYRKFWSFSIHRTVRRSDAYSGRASGRILCLVEAEVTRLIF